MTRTTGMPATRPGVRALAVAAGAGLGVLGLSALGAAGIGWVYSGMVLDTRRVMLYPDRVLDVSDGVVALVATRLTRQRGTWGLNSADGLAVVGDVLSSDDRVVRRPLLSGPPPAPGAAVGIEPSPWDADPSVRGIAFDEVLVDAPVGPAPWSRPPGAQAWPWPRPTGAQA